MSNKDGGPAFPVKLGEYSGMTLRDYFAAAALESGMCPYNSYDLADCARWAYAMADEVLKARAQQ